MNKEQKITLMTEELTTARTKIAEYNDLVNEDKFDDAEKVMVDVNKAIDEYNGIARTLAFDECKQTPDPMLAAVKTLTYEVLAIKDEKTKIGDKEYISREIVKKDKPIDLLKLSAYCGGIGKDPEWNFLVEKFNLFMTAQTAIDLGIDPTEIHASYAMSKIAKAKELGKNPCSKTNILKTLQTVINAMIGEEYKPLTHDVNYLLKIYTRKGRKALSVVAANHNYMRNYIAEICHRIVTNGRYEIEYKKEKKQN